MFVANGIFCLIGGVAFALEWLIVLFLAINFGMGGAVTMLTILLMLWFRRLQSEQLLTAVGVVGGEV